MTYEAWRISYQSSEQAARAAYAECARLCARLEAAETAWKVSDKSCYGLTEKVIPNLRDQLESAEKERDALRVECDAITELNFAQWLALENVRLLAARYHNEEWASHMLRFIENAGTNKAQITRLQVNNALAKPAPSIPEGWKKDLFCIQHAMAMNNWNWESDASNDTKRAAYAAVARLLATTTEAKP